MSLKHILQISCQVAEQEKQLILEFESHLAAATSKVMITESNSLLIAQLTTMDPA